MCVAVKDSIRRNVAVSFFSRSVSVRARDTTGSDRSTFVCRLCCRGDFGRHVVALPLLIGPLAFGRCPLLSVRCLARGNSNFGLRPHERNSDDEGAQPQPRLP